MRTKALTICLVLGLLSPAVASTDGGRWEELTRAAIRAAEQRQFVEADRLLRQALQEARDTPRARALTLQALIRLSVAMRRVGESRAYAQQMVELTETFRQPGYQDMAERFRGSARAMRLIGQEDEAVALDAAARRIEQPAGTACGDRLAAVTRSRPLTAIQRQKAAQAIAALEALGAWSADPQPKDRVDYAGRLAKVEATAGEYFTSVGDDQDEPTLAIKGSLVCFQDAAQAWPRVSESWASGARRAHEARAALGPAPALVQAQASVPAPVSVPAPASVPAPNGPADGRPTPAEPRTQPVAVATKPPRAPEPVTVPKLGDMSSVQVGGECVRVGMPLTDLIRRFDLNMHWEFRWDEKMRTKDGLVTGLSTRPGTEANESPYVLLFAGDATTVGDLRLKRISWTGDASEAARIGLAKRPACR
ncbi:MAG TPA: hypothetical protein VEH80_10850 [Candidatus Bathyarchaeia archaeon]|nr:hypothetical protein [Candidatus Bathyarchaeia archaeon]